MPTSVHKGQRWNTLLICPHRDKNSGGNDLWSNALPVTPWRCPFYPQVNIPRPWCRLPLFGYFSWCERHFDGQTDAVAGQRTLSSGFKSQSGQIWRVYHPSIHPLGLNTARPIDPRMCTKLFTMQQHFQFSLLMICSNVHDLWVWVLCC